MSYSRTIPIDNPSCHEQTELSEIGDKDFHQAFTAPKVSCCQRFGQLLIFIISFGWLRLALIIAGFVLFALFMLPIVIFANCQRVIKCFNSYGTFIMRIFNRIFMLFLGIIWVQKKGTRDPEARNYIYNHTSLLDGIIMYYCKPFRVVVMAGVKQIFFFGKIFIAGNSIFIDRTQSGGNANKIKEAMEDHSSDMPLAIAPEGKISNGTVLFRFHTGGFLANEKIQPVTIRYHTIWGCCACTYNWVCNGFFEWLWGALCIPFAFVTVTYLDTISPEEIINLQPIERADMCQLKMANSLGVLAFTRSSREIFHQE